MVLNAFFLLHRVPKTVAVRRTCCTLSLAPPYLQLQWWTSDDGIVSYRQTSGPLLCRRRHRPHYLLDAQWPPTTTAYKTVATRRLASSASTVAPPPPGPSDYLSTLKLPPLSQTSTQNAPLQKSALSDAREKEQRLQRMLNFPPEEQFGGKRRGGVNRESFLEVLRALSVSGEADATIRAERWIRKLEELSQDNGNDPELKPNSECYLRVIETWCNALNEDIEVSLARAEKMLQPRRRPDTACFNAFLDLCTKGRKSNHSDFIARRNARRAEEMLKFMIQDVMTRGREFSRIAPNTDSFNFVIRGWTRCRKHVWIFDRVSQALRDLEEYSQTVDPMVCPNSKSFAMLLDSVSVQAKLKVAEVCNKNKAYDIDVAQDEMKNGIKEIKALESFIAEMHNEKRKGRHQLAPNTSVYNILMNTWSHLAKLHEHAPMEAEKVLQKMNNFRDGGDDSLAPDVFSYSIVMRTWANSKHATRSQRVVWWLSQLQREYERSNYDPRLRPTTETYNTAIRACASAGDTDQAGQLLKTMMQSWETTTNGNEATAAAGYHPPNVGMAPPPNTESFVQLIDGHIIFAKRGILPAIEQAVGWLKVLMELEKAEVANFQTVNELFLSILGASRACAFGRPQVLDLAVETFDMLRQSHHPMECLAFSRLLDTGLLSLSSPANNHVRTAFVEELIKECIEAGLVGGPVLRSLTNGVVHPTGWTWQESARLTSKHFPEWPLPSEWTRNLKPFHLPQRTDLERTNFYDRSSRRTTPRSRWVGKKPN